MSEIRNITEADWLVNIAEDFWEWSQTHPLSFNERLKIEKACRTLEYTLRGESDADAS